MTCYVVTVEGEPGGWLVEVESEGEAIAPVCSTVPRAAEAEREDVTAWELSLWRMRFGALDRLVRLDP